MNDGDWLKGCGWAALDIKEFFTKYPYLPNAKPSLDPFIFVSTHLFIRLLGCGNLHQGAQFSGICN